MRFNSGRVGALMRGFLGCPVMACAFIAVGIKTTAAQMPQFSLWVTQVNGFPCESCPTRNLPENEVFPGDILRIDAFVAGWDDDRTAGVCSGSPNHGFGQVCDINNPGMCSGMHCSGSNGIPCQAGGQCFPFPACVPSQCIPSPQVAAFQWTLDSASLLGIEHGTLGPAVLDCDQADCGDVSQGSCPCAQFYQSVTECTCAFNHSCSANGTCGPTASAFIEPQRSDFLFFNRQTFLNINVSDPDIQFLGALTGFDAAVRDAEMRFYLGTLMLEVSDDAGGPFTVRMIGNANFTFLNDRQPATIGPASFLSATINVPRCAFVSCEDFDDCTIDVMDPLTCACSYQPVACPTGQRCEVGDCVDVPRCPRILDSIPENCGIDARVPHPPDAPTQIQGLDRLVLWFDADCDVTRLRIADFAVSASFLASTTPRIAALQPLGSAVEIVLDAVIGMDDWFCVWYLPTGETVCVAHVPGDVNGDQHVRPSDVSTILGWFQRMPMIEPPVQRSDLNRSSATNTEDLLTAIDLMNGAAMYAARLNAHLPAKCPSR